MIQAIFLDRDGVINRPPQNRYITHWKQFQFLPGALRAIRRLTQEGKSVVVVSNQAGVGRGLYSLGELRRINRNMLRRIHETGGRVRAVYYCTHRPQDLCACRKPKPGMLQRASRSYRIDLRRSFIVGDNETDLLLGQSVGCRTVLVLTGITRPAAARLMKTKPDHTAKNLVKAVDWILKQP